MNVKDGIGTKDQDSLDDAAREGSARLHTNSKDYSGIKDQDHIVNPEREGSATLQERSKRSGTTTTRNAGGSSSGHMEAEQGRPDRTVREESATPTGTPSAS